MMSPLKRKMLFATTALLIAVGAFGFNMYTGQGADASVPPAAPPAVQVGVSTVKEQQVSVWSSFSARLKAVDFAEIRPEVGGRIMEVRFQDGQIVNAGDVLLVIDPSAYEAAVAKAKANLASATTNATFTKTELTRAENLIKTEAISKSLYDERLNSDRKAQASVAVASAELKQAQLDLDHAYVKAPITGRVSRAEITIGNLVQTGPGAPVLTTIASNQGIYADFEIDEQSYLNDIRGHGPAENVPVELTVQGDGAHPYKGVIQSFDNRIDTASGTIRARAFFENADSSLMPGMTVAVRVANSTEDKTLLVPQGAINVDQNKKFVYIVGADNKVAYREVEFGKQVDSSRIVLSGLKAGERVIVDGIQHVRPDSLVDAKEITDKKSAL